MIVVEDVNRNFKASGGLLMDVLGLNITRYFGCDAHVTVNLDVGVLSHICFSGCKSLQLIAIPRSVEFLLPRF
jgi:hypothetical protein